MEGLYSVPDAERRLMKEQISAQTVEWRFRHSIRMRGRMGLSPEMDSKPEMPGNMDKDQISTEEINTEEITEGTEIIFLLLQ